MTEWTLPLSPRILQHSFSLQLLVLQSGCVCQKPNGGHGRQCGARDPAEHGWQGGAFSGAQVLPFSPSPPQPPPPPTHPPHHPPQPPCAPPEGSPSLQLWNLRMHKKKVTHVALNPCCDWFLATASVDQTVKIWDLRQVRGKSSFLHSLPHNHPVNAGVIYQTSSFLQTLPVQPLLAFSLKVQKLLG